MPTYPEGTRQWAEARIAKYKAEIAQNPYCESCETADYVEYRMHRKFIIDEAQWLLDQEDTPEGTPTYSPAELEAAGQGVIEL